MTSIAPSQVSIPAAVVGVVVGVDTHQDEHCAAVLDLRGAHLATCTIAATPTGYAQLCSWATRFGPVTAWGVEGTGSYGAGLTRTPIRPRTPLVTRTTSKPTVWSRSASDCGR